MAMPKSGDGLRNSMTQPQGAALRVMKYVRFQFPGSLLTCYAFFAWPAGLFQ